MQGSSAEVAMTLGLPVVLLVNAASSAYSTGAVIHGFKTFKPNINVVGVVFNRVASENHYQFLKDAALDAGVESLGYIPKTASLDVPSRHLGLSLEELQKLDYFPDKVADLIDAHVDVARLLELCTIQKPLYREEETKVTAQPLRIAVASDEAFNFVYPENIRALERIGEVQFFSPLRDSALPVAALVYFPGGYPEFYLEQLSRNTDLRSAIKAYAEAGGKVLAECGGMMYLCAAIIDEEGKVDWQKPISCHLYPIRITEYSEFSALNYHEWPICSDACALGMELQVPVYKFLKTPLIRKYGEEFYETLSEAAEEWSKEYGKR